MADLSKVMEREMLHSEHAARCFLEAMRRGRKRMIRIAWSIGGKQGHGQWVPDTESKRALYEQIVRDQNRRYGAWTHWLAESPPNAIPSAEPNSANSAHRGLMT